MLGKHKPKVPKPAKPNIFDPVPLPPDPGTADKLITAAKWLALGLLVLYVINAVDD